MAQRPAVGLLWTDNEVQSPQACRHDGLSLSVLSTTPPTQPLCPPHLIPPAFASPSGPSACIYLSPGGHAHARGPSSNPICPSSCLPDPLIPGFSSSPELPPHSVPLTGKPSPSTVEDFVCGHFRLWPWP